MVVCVLQACIDESCDLVEFLVDHGARMDIRDNEGWTALHAAASCGSVEIAQWVCVCFIHFIVIFSQTGLALDFNWACWEAFIVSGISFTFNTTSLDLWSMSVPNLYRVSKHARNSVQILEASASMCGVCEVRITEVFLRFCFEAFPSRKKAINLSPTKE